MQRMSSIVLLLASLNVTAGDGLFLDLDIGVYTGDDIECGDCNHTEIYLSDNDPLGILRIGYEYKHMHLYYQHMSSVLDVRDHGINTIMIGVRFQ